MKKLNILYVIDRWNWAYDFNAQEQSRYSIHTITRKPLSEIKLEDLVNIDILYFHGPNINKNQSDALTKICRRYYPKIKIVGVYSVESPVMFLSCDLIACTSSNYYNTCVRMYEKTKTPVIFFPKGIDSNLFNPGVFHKDLIVGWSGREAEVKRTHLLDKLDFNVIKQSQHGERYFTKDANRDTMVNFYHSISCFVMTSESEALPRSALEAMSSGLPVISTSVGSLPLVLDKSALVSVYPEDKVVNEINTKLWAMGLNPTLRWLHGARNRQFIEEKWSWNVLQPYWDKIFNELKQNHIQSIRVYDDEYRRVNL